MTSRALDAVATRSGWMLYAVGALPYFADCLREVGDTLHIWPDGAAVGAHPGDTATFACGLTVDARGCYLVDRGAWRRPAHAHLCERCEPHSANFSDCTDDPDSPPSEYAVFVKEFMAAQDEASWVLLSAAVLGRIEGHELLDASAALAWPQLKVVVAKWCKRLGELPIGRVLGSPRTAMFRSRRAEQAGLNQKTAPTGVDLADLLDEGDWQDLVTHWEVCDLTAAAEDVWQEEMSMFLSERLDERLN